MGHCVWFCRLRIWDATTGEREYVLRGHSGQVTSVALSPDGTRIVSGSDNTVRLWSAFTGKRENVWRGHSGQVKSVAFSPDGTQIASGSSDLGHALECNSREGGAHTRRTF